MRAAGAELCAAFTRAERECFDRWCALFDRRTDPGPDAAVASQAELHDAALVLREWCLAGPALAEAERPELMVCQAQGELAAAADVRAHRSAEDRDRIRSGWASARWHIICQRDALTCGLGWPRRSESVTAATWHYGPDGEKVPVRGEGIYLNSYDIFEVSHEVWLPALGATRRGGTVLVCWSAGTDDDRRPLGPADPAGDIGLRLRNAPQRMLPVPLMRWPGPADVGIDVPPPPVPAAGLALFTVAEVAGLPEGWRPRPAQRSRPRRSAPAMAATADLTLF